MRKESTFHEDTFGRLTIQEVIDTYWSIFQDVIVAAMVNQGMGMPSTFWISTCTAPTAPPFFIMVSGNNSLAPRAATIIQRWHALPLGAIKA